MAGAFLTLLAATFILLQPSARAADQPNFLLPWQHGVAWLTGSAGFHNTNDALDFFPPDTPLGGNVKCEGDPDWVYQESAYFVLASAPGTVVQAGAAAVLIDHGGGWYSRYYHMTGFVVQPGDVVAAGQRLARPSTLGACSTGPHVHFWVQGPNGETTANVTLSSIPTTQIQANSHYSDTFNFEGATPTPEPTPEPTSTPVPTDSPTPEPSGTPIPQVRGDANCDGLVNTNDATTILWMLNGYADAKCGLATADTDCDGILTVADALGILLSVSDLTPLPSEPCVPPDGTPPVEPTPAPTSTRNPGS
ncbi:MAG: peptidoglycan DD-metalloendopeptidase family protein [Dehalococcoidia bacterium]